MFVNDLFNIIAYYFIHNMLGMLAFAVGLLGYELAKYYDETREDLDGHQSTE